MCTYVYLSQESPIHYSKYDPLILNSQIAMLKEGTREKILTLISLGFSRRSAAHYVCCAPSTISRLANRDADFAHRLATAEKNLEFEALRSLRAAARNPRYWRAAAWLLERKNHDDFAFSPPGCISIKDVDAFYQHLSDMLCSELPARMRKSIIKKLEKFDVLNNPNYVPGIPPHKQITDDAEKLIIPKSEMQHPSSEECEDADFQPVPNSDHSSTSGDER